MSQETKPATKQQYYLAVGIVLTLSLIGGGLLANAITNAEAATEAKLKQREIDGVKTTPTNSEKLKTIADETKANQKKKAGTKKN